MGQAQVAVVHYLIRESGPAGGVPGLVRDIGSLAAPHAAGTEVPRTPRVSARALQPPKGPSVAAAEEREERDCGNESGDTARRAREDARAPAHGFPVLV